MFEKVPPRPELVKGEHEVLSFWEKSRAFDKLREKNRGKERWSFLDGPITANNPMGVHHAWGRTYKDLFQRYFAMLGRDQRFQNGFDCQGLWVEVEVEKEKGFNSKRDIEKFGLERFINACKERVLKYADIMTQQSIRLGQWMDWENSYFTMSPENNYTIWSFLKKCHSRGLIYKGLDSMPWCPRCGTGISEQERREGYKEVEDEAVYVRFPLSGRSNEYLLVWTTTPWTLAANVAAAVNPDLTYLKVRQGDDLYYVTQNRLAVLESKSKSFGSPEVIEQITGRDMLGWTYAGPFDELPAAEEAAAHHRVIPFDEVTENEGTGIVHIAPGCGKEDFDLSKAENLPVIAPIDDSGIYTKGFGFLSGKYAGAVSPEIYESLKSKGLFYKREKYLHDYPHCWRCDTPLLFRAVDEWYIDMSWRDEIRKVVKQIKWIPDYGESQELDWLNNMGDWMISKKRYWGLALPIWQCQECEHFDVIGSREELQERAEEGWDQFEGHTPHRPWIDAVKIKCAECGGTSHRIADVGNPWLDAGIVPYSTVGYNTDRDHWSQWVPADFVVESFPGQFRNWFYALLAMSTMMEGIAPFKTLLGHALVRDENGEEMHKSKGNSIAFEDAADKVGADVMRWMFARHTPTNNMNFGYKALEQIERKTFGTLWNTYLFFTNYAILDGFDPGTKRIPVSERPEIDRWILSNLQLLVESGNRHLKQYWAAPFVRSAEEFIEELSNWYVRRNRQRFWNPVGQDDRDKLAAYQTLYEVLTTLLKLTAPIIPFLTERMYQNLCARMDGAPESVHHCDYPEPDDRLIDRDLSDRMRVVMQAVATGHALREQARIKTRHPIAEIRIACPPEEREALQSLEPLLLEELNVKRLTLDETLGDLAVASAGPNFGSLGPRFGKSVQRVAVVVRSLNAEQIASLARGETVSAEDSGETYEILPTDVHMHVQTQEGWAIGEAGALQVALDVRTTPELRLEGLARDVVRHIQQLRRDSGLNIEDRIKTVFDTDAQDLLEAIETWKSYISNETQSVSLERQALTGAQSVQIDSARLDLHVERVRSAPD